MWKSLCIFGPQVKPPCALWFVGAQRRAGDVGVGMERRSRAMKSWLGQACSLKHTPASGVAESVRPDGTAEQGVGGSLSSYPEGSICGGRSSRSRGRRAHHTRGKRRQRVGVSSGKSARLRPLSPGDRNQEVRGAGAPRSAVIQGEAE